MFIREGTHGPDCNSRTFPTHCKYCHEPVFFFTCDCGSRVFFDALGQPWPQHKCTEYLLDQYGKDFVEQGMAIMMMTPGIERSYAERVQRDALLTQQPGYDPPEIVRQDPYMGLEVAEDGVIREMIPDLTLSKRYGIQPDSLGAQMIGSIVQGPYAQVTIHVEPLGDDDHSSFTFLVNQATLKRADAVKGDLVTFKVTGLVLGGSPIWLCTDLNNIFGATRK